MDRQEIITDIFESISYLGKKMFLRGPGPLAPGLPPRAQMGILFLVAHDGAQNIKQIAEKFDITPSAATQLVNHLVESGLLARKEDEKDHRKICIVLSEKGQKKIEEAKKIRLEKITKMFQALNNEELMELKKIYSKIIHHIS